MVFCLPKSVPTDFSSVMADMFPQTPFIPHLNHSPLISSHLIAAVHMCVFARLHVFVPAPLALIFPTCFHFMLVCMCAYTLYRVALGVGFALSACAFPYIFLCVLEYRVKALSSPFSSIRVIS